MIKRKSNLIITAVMLVVCGLLCLIPETHQTVYSDLPRVQVRIDSVNNDGLNPIGIVYSGAQICGVTVLTGERAGETGSAVNYMNAALDKDKLFEVGDTGYALVHSSSGELGITLIDHYRGETLFWLIALLSAGLILFGGIVGCGALISLAASTIIVWKLLIPLLLEMVNPILAAFVTVVALTVMIDLLVAGFTKRYAVALMGSLSGTLVTCVFALVFTEWLKLDGGDIPYLVPLLSQTSLQLDPRGLFIGMMFIANSGAVMDLSMDISVSCHEIQVHSCGISRRALFKSGREIGRNVLGTMATTLMLAYSGNYLSMLMYFAGQGTPPGDIINLKYIASQLLNTLVGSFGLVATASITAVIASVMYVPPGQRALEKV
ncbi:MAG: YibE/F family protein [Bacillota bacterium]